MNGTLLEFCVCIQNGTRETLRRGHLPLCACSASPGVTPPFVREHSESEAAKALRDSETSITPPELVRVRIRCGNKRW